MSKVNPYKLPPDQMQSVMKQIMPYEQRLLSGSELDQIKVAIALLDECNEWSFGTHVTTYKYHIGDRLYELVTTISGEEIGIYELIPIDWDATKTN